MKVTKTLHYIDEFGGVYAKDNTPMLCFEFVNQLLVDCPDLINVTLSDEPFEDSVKLFVFLRGETCFPLWGYNAHSVRGCIFTQACEIVKEVIFPNGQLGVKPFYIGIKKHETRKI